MKTQVSRKQKVNGMSHEINETSQRGMNKETGNQPPDDEMEEVEYSMFELIRRMVAIIDLVLVLLQTDTGWVEQSVLCGVLKASPWELKQLRDSGELPYSKFRGKIYYQIKDINNYFERHMELATSNGIKETGPEKAASQEFKKMQTGDQSAKWMLC